MKVKVVKTRMYGDKYSYGIYSSTKKFFGWNIWNLEYSFCPDVFLTDEQAKDYAIKYANDLLKPKQPIKYSETIYENKSH